MSKELQISLMIGIVLFSAFFFHRTYGSRNSLSERIVSLEVKVAILQEKLDK